MVLGELKEGPPEYGPMTYQWYCSICNSDNLLQTLHTCGWTKKELEDNKRLLRFAKGMHPSNERPKSDRETY